MSTNKEHVYFVPVSDVSLTHESEYGSVSSTINHSLTVCVHEPQLTSSGYLEAMINYVNQCLEEPRRQIMLEVLNTELSKLQTRNLLALHELIILIALYTAMILVGSCGSLLVIYAVIRQPRMRTPRNLFIVNLATSDLILCLFTQPFNLLRTLYWHYDWTLGQTMCKAVAMAQAANIFVSTISIIAVALDRLQVIVYPTRTKVHTAGAMVIIACSWVFALLMASPMIAFSSVSHGTIRSDGSVCSANTMHSHWLRRSKFVYGILTLIFQYCLPITIVIYAYTRICLRIRKRPVSRRAMRLNEILSDMAPGATTANSRNVPRINLNTDGNLDNQAVVVLAHHGGQPEPETPEANEISRLELASDDKTSKVPLSYTVFSPNVPLACQNRPSQDREKVLQRRLARTNALLVAVTVTFVLAWLPLHIFNLTMDLKESQSASDIEELDSHDWDSGIYGLENQTQLFTYSTDPVQLPFHGATTPSSTTIPPPPPSSSTTTTTYFTGRFWTLVQSFCLFCVLLSACINPVLYGWLNENFHKEFKDMLSACSCLKWTARKRPVSVLIANTRLPNLTTNNNVNNNTVVLNT